MFQVKVVVAETGLSETIPDPNSCHCSPGKPGGLWVEGRGDYLQPTPERHVFSATETASFIGMTYTPACCLEKAVRQSRYPSSNFGRSRVEVIRFVTLASIALRANGM